MEVDEIQTFPNKFPRRSSDEKAEDGEVKRQRNTGGSGRGRGGVGGGATLDFTAGVGGVGRLCGWPSSRIVRVSRASGGKDRHSKVLTSKGLRDRRVRLSVNTAIQFYDLQDRLGYDQPSKAVEWLLKAADTSISELPPISTTFPDTPKQFNDEKGPGVIVTEHGFDSEIIGGGGEGLDLAQNQQGGALSNTACSSTSETSKGSGGGGLSLSRSESRLKARERARERAAKDKEKEKEKESETAFVVHQQQKHNQNVRSIPQNATFTELLTSGFTGTSNVGNQHSNNNSPNGSGGGVHESNFFQKSPRNWSSAAMDYFGGGGMLGPSTATRSTHGFHGQIQLGNTMQQALATHGSSPFFTVAGDTNQELHSFSLIPEHSNEYNLNFSISSTNSSGLAGFNRGTLQSNSSTPSLLAQIQRFSSADHNGSSPSPFFLGTALPPNAAVENHHHQQQHHFLPTGFDSGLQLFYGDGSRHADQKGKGKN